MKKLLPKTYTNPEGFTLIELLVTITIVAILGTIGITVFGGAQRSARDGKRTADVDSLARSIETSRDFKETTKSYNYSTTNFSADFTQTLSDPSTGWLYCYAVPVTNGAVTALPANPTANWNGATPACPTDYTNVANISIAAKTGFKVCAWLEGANSAYCKANL